MSFSEELQQAQDQSHRRGRGRMQRGESDDSRQARRASNSSPRILICKRSSYRKRLSNCSLARSSPRASALAQTPRSPQAALEDTEEKLSKRARLGHDFHHVRPRWRHGKRRGARGCLARERAWRVERSRGTQAVCLRRQAPHDAGQRRPLQELIWRRRHRHRHPHERLMDTGRARHQLLRCFPYR